MNLFNEFNKDCESFRNFDEAIKYDTTRRSYHYSLNVFMRFAGLDNYDKLAKMSTHDIQKLLKNWILSQKKEAQGETTTQQVSVADELTKLAKLKEQGVLSEEEFSKMKQDLINKSSS